jgi:hypothetical protein
MNTEVDGHELGEESNDGFTAEDWVNATLEAYDLDAAYKEQVLPLVRQLEAKCHELKMPFYCRFVVEQDITGSRARTTSHMANVNRVTPDIIAMQIMHMVNHEYVLDLISLVNTCHKKYSKIKESKDVPS